MMPSPNGWTAHKLDELGFVGRGRSRHRPRNEPSLYGGQYPFFQTGDIKATDLYLSKYMQTYNEKGLAQSKLWKPGTLCITIAANIAETAILAIEACFPDSVVGFVPDSKKADVRFIKYSIDLMKLRMQNISRGTTQDNLSVDKLLSFDFIVPPVATQAKIADVLAAYDDLIENNTRRIKMLEQMAQALYREWFVTFRFPGHQKVKLVDSRLGKIPEGWKVGRLDDALILQRGFDLPTRERQPGSVPIYASTGVVGTHSTFKVRGPGIVTGRSGSLGSVIYIDEDFWPLNTTLWVKEFREVTPLYAFHLLTDLKLGSFNSGAAVPTLNRNDVHGLPVIIPSESALGRFDAVVQPLFALHRTLTARNKSLTACRDMLLPRLVSGELPTGRLEKGPQ
jgi:type I restriction enzyme S subunit